MSPVRTGTLFLSVAAIITAPSIGAGSCEGVIKMFWNKGKGALINCEPGISEEGTPHNLSVLEVGVQLEKDLQSD